MRLISYRAGMEPARIGAVQDDSVVDLTGIAPDMLSLIEMGAAGLAKAADALSAGDARRTPLKEVTLLAPIPVLRRNVLCLGLNYADHAAESSSARGQQTELPEYPVIFTKATTSINGPFSDIPYDPDVSTQIDWEIELGVVIGKAGKNIAAEEAMNHVFGYTVVNDISARDLQWRHKQFFKGKSLDGACPMGPWIVTADNISDPHNLHLITRVNGMVKQDSNTHHLIFDVPTTIAHLSSGMTLLSGDVIATGTPSGVGFARKPPEYLKPGDVVECEIEEIGTIRNKIAAAQ